MAKNDQSTNNNKQIILIAVAVIAIIGTIIFAIKTMKNEKETEEFKIDGIDIIQKNTLLDDTKVDSLDITNQVLYNIDNLSTYSAILENNTDKDIYINQLYAVFTINDKDTKILVAKNATIKSNERKTISVNFDSDVSEVTKIEHVMEK